MATLRDKRKLAAFTKENCQENLSNNLAQNRSVAKTQEDHITQVSEEIEDIITKKLSRESSRTESCIQGALSQLDDFLLSPLLQSNSGSAPETSRNTLNINQGTNEDDLSWSSSWSLGLSEPNNASFWPRRLDSYDYWLVFSFCICHCGHHRPEYFCTWKICCGELLSESNNFSVGERRLFLRSKFIARKSI